MLRVSVQAGLDDIKTHLDTCGFEVINMEECYQPIEAVVYLGEVREGPPLQAKAAASTVMVNAAGLTPQEVAGALQRY